MSLGTSAFNSCGRNLGQQREFRTSPDAKAWVPESCLDRTDRPALGQIVRANHLIAREARLRESSSCGSRKSKESPKRNSKEPSIVEPCTTRTGGRVEWGANASPER